MKTTFFFRMGDRYAILDSDMRVCSLQDDRPKAGVASEVVEVPRPRRVDWASPWLAAQLSPFTASKSKVNRARSR
jgi:hypothetical protein